MTSNRHGLADVESSRSSRNRSLEVVERQSKLNTGKEYDHHPTNKKKIDRTNLKLNRDKNGYVQACLSAHGRFCRDSRRSWDKVLSQRCQIYLADEFSTSLQVDSNKFRLLHLCAAPNWHLQYGFLNERGESYAEAAAPEKAQRRSEKALPD